MGQILRLRRQAVFAQDDKLGGVTLLQSDDHLHTSATKPKKPTKKIKKLIQNGLIEE